MPLHPLHPPPLHPLPPRLPQRPQNPLPTQTPNPKTTQHTLHPKMLCAYDNDQCSYTDYEEYTYYIGMLRFGGIKGG